MNKLSLLTVVACCLCGSLQAEEDDTRQAARDSKLDRRVLVHDGVHPNQLCCDTTLREMPDGSWVIVQTGFGPKEPHPENWACIARSTDEGKTWSEMKAINLGVKTEDPTRAVCVSELSVTGGRATMVIQVHNGRFGEWFTYFVHSDDSCHTWSELEPAPGRLAERSMIRNRIELRDGRLMMPFQWYTTPGGNIDPRNGVIVSSDGGKTWREYGNIRLSEDPKYRCWAEANVVELADGTIAMIIRRRIGGLLYRAESKDGGKTWPEFAEKTNIPNPSSKATIYGLGGDKVAILHNPNPRVRRPLSLWISYDGMKTWPYRRVLVPEACDKGGRINYPDGFVSKDGKYLHLAFDNNRRRCEYYGAKLPE